MSPVASTMRSALDEFFKGQAEVEGTCLVDYYQFDTVIERAYQDKPVAEAEAFIVPRGGTALLDALAQATIEVGEKLAALPEARRPGKVLVVVVTDGYENASRWWNAATVKELVTRQQDVYNWDYVFLGANLDAVAVGADFGFKADKSLTFNIHDAQAVGATSAVLSSYTTTYRGGGNAAFSDSDRDAAVGK